MCVCVWGLFVYCCVLMYDLTIYKYSILEYDLLFMNIIY